jgi:multimeric flavodoxin WrbA
MRRYDHMKVLLINGSPKAKGNTALALQEMAAVFAQEGIETEIIHVGNQDIRGCIACGSCGKTGKCVFDDAVNEIAKKFEEADGLIVGSPVHYAAPSGALISLLDRLFYSTRFDKRDKVGAAVVCARRGGCTAAFDVLNKYFSISGMPIATSTYWNQVHGANAEDAALDEEGMQCMRNLARNTAFLIKSIKLGKGEHGMPQVEKQFRTNFIRNL